MRGMTKLSCVCAAAAALVTGAVRAAEDERPRIQIAILLDTSGSMSGLIEQAKTQLWRIVNEFITARKDGKRPDLQVALYEYGKDSIPASEGYLRMILPLTDDLDRVSEELFVLRTNGGSEYCGKVIQAATRGLRWSSSNGDLKAIFIAGNEPFTQGDVDYREACRAAVAKGIVVNTIHCGDYQTGVRTNWKDGAVLADGSYGHIDHNRTVVHISAPQDKEIARLNAELNRTYIAYGVGGKKGKERQFEQDRNAQASAPASMAQRAVSKASSYYKNEGWDLVDASKKGKVKLDELKEEELPEEMREMSSEEKEAHVKAQSEKRATIQKRMLELNRKRKEYVAEERKKLGESAEGTLDAAVISPARKQAARCRFSFQ